MAPPERTRKCFNLYFVCFLAILSVTRSEHDVPSVYGYTLDNIDEFSFTDGGRLFLFINQEVPLRLFGQGLRLGQRVSFTNQQADKFDNCNDFPKTKTFHLTSVHGNSTSAIVPVKVDTASNEDEVWYMCFKEDDSDWMYQGNDSWLTFRFRSQPVKQNILPMIWLQVIVIIVLLLFSGLFSGLNLGLMALDQTELKILTNCGSPREKKYAKRISPLRKRGNFLLCTILLGNVLVNNTLTILLDDLTGSGYAAVLGATAGIVIFGEIIPQAVCSRYGLAIGANTIWFTWAFMIITFPLAFPISKILDWILGEEIGNVYNRDRLRELLRLTQEKTDLINDEVNIITGALELSKKTVSDIMTQIEDVYMIDNSSVLDFDTMNDIMKTGYTRIPVYEQEKTNIVAILNIKDLAFIDPDDKTPLKTICDFYKHPIKHVFEDVKLSEALQEFKEGRSHMAFVQRVHGEGPGDPYYETVGVVTLEDVIEEIIQSEIIDETDTVTDNRKRKQRQGQVRDFSVFNTPDELQINNYPKMAPQLALATYQYLHTTVPAFKAEVISEAVLQRLIKQNIVFELRVKDRTSSECFIYQKGKKCDFFVLILQGRVEVTIGKDQMTFEGGPFTYFGNQALTGVQGSQSVNQSMTSLNSTSTDLLHQKHPQYCPDFTVKAISDFVQFLKIQRSYYEAARKATAMERKTKTGDEDPFTKEWRKVTSAHQDNISTKTDAESVIITPDKSDSSPVPDKEKEEAATTSPVSVVIDEEMSRPQPGVEVDVGLRQRSGTQDSSLTDPENAAHNQTSSTDEDANTSIHTPLISSHDHIATTDATNDESVC